MQAMFTKKIAPLQSFKSKRGRDTKNGQSRNGQNFRNTAKVSSDLNKNSNLAICIKIFRLTTSLCFQNYGRNCTGPLLGLPSYRGAKDDWADFDHPWPLKTFSIFSRYVIVFIRIPMSLQSSLPFSDFHSPKWDGTYIHTNEQISKCSIAEDETKIPHRRWRSPSCQSSTNQ